MNMNEYFRLLLEGRKEEARIIRISSIPDKLIKFVWLSNDDSDEKKFKSLRNNEIWFSNLKFLNDPYEFKGMIIDRQKLHNEGCPDNEIDLYNTIFDFNDYGITCLSANKIDYLPMWAYYTNNHKGFCIEYNAVKKDCIHEVIYEPQRIKVSSLILQCKKAAIKAMRTGQNDNEADMLVRVLLQNLFIKGASWKHEKEYRIVYQIGDTDGKNVSVEYLGIRPSRIIAGINCSRDNVEILNQISNDLGLGDCYKSRIHDDEYTIDIWR